MQISRPVYLQVRWTPGIGRKTLPKDFFASLRKQGASITVRMGGLQNRQYTGKIISVVQRPVDSYIELSGVKRPIHIDDIIKIEVHDVIEPDHDLIPSKKQQKKHAVDHFRAHAWASEAHRRFQDLRSSADLDSMTSLKGKDLRLGRLLDELFASTIPEDVRYPILQAVRGVLSVTPEVAGAVRTWPEINKPDGLPIFALAKRMDRVGAREALADFSRIEINAYRVYDRLANDMTVTGNGEVFNLCKLFLYEI